ncbi:MAG TPA: potassium transporter Kup [Methylophilaceae bacterium]|jgi:KUP system potassium uptake protein
MQSATTSVNLTIKPEIKKSATPMLALAALGVVYGDIGTSPLYTLHEIFAGAHNPVPITHDNILGILSLMFWALMMIVSFKYVLFIMRADNRGEGGIMALMALVRNIGSTKQVAFLMTLGLLGAALFYGDAVITPAISVLSAIEGLQIAAPSLKAFVLPLTVAVLVMLFSFQKYGTATVGKLFGPIVVIWFVTLAILGVMGIARVPAVLQALNPSYAIGFLAGHGPLGFFALAAVVLTVTGAEALYADMGHFGRKPVQLAWFFIVLPALVLNYFGQGALLLTNPAAIENPFYLLAPTWALYPLVALSTIATVIASQAVISGAYSITQQAIQLGYCPRMEIQHTSSSERGQIYVPTVNWGLMIAVVLLVLAFGSSSSLAAAYGIAVTGTMIITTILAYVVACNTLGWNRSLVSALVAVFLVVDIAFFSANLTKIPDGGWLPLVFGIALFVLMSTWRMGRQLLTKKLVEESMQLAPFIQSLNLSSSSAAIQRVSGSAVFLTHNQTIVPHALLHSLKHYKALHERVILLTMKTEDTPVVETAKRVVVEALGGDFYRVLISYGFTEKPDIPAALMQCREYNLVLDEMDTSYFLGRETLIPKVNATMALWREKLFINMFRNAGSAADYFGLPHNRVVELGAQVVL